MQSTSIFLLTFGLLIAVAMARPGRRPWSGHHSHHEKPENELSQENAWSTYRLPNHIRLPRLLTEKLGEPVVTFTARKVFDGKYLLISPALLFKLQEVDTDIESSTTVVPEISTTDQPDSAETTTVAVDEETTTVAVDEDTITDPELDESTTPLPSFFKKRSFSINDDEQLFFPDD